MAHLDDRDDALPRPARPRKSAVLAIGAGLSAILAGGGLLLHSAFDTDQPELTVQKELATLGSDPPPAIAVPGDRAAYFAPPPSPLPAAPPSPEPLSPEPAGPPPFVPPAAWKAPIKLMTSTSAGPAAAMPTAYQQPASPASTVLGPPAGYDRTRFSPAGAGDDRAAHAAALASLVQRTSQSSASGESASPFANALPSPFAQGDRAPLYGSKAGIVQASQDASRSVSRLRVPASRRALSPGTIIHAVLTTGINTDLPGSFNARVTRTVWDEVDGDVPLIPQSSLITGTVSSQVEYGEERAFLVAKYIRLAGSNAYLDVGGLNAAALDGTAGVPSDVNNHYGRTIGVGILTAVLGAGSAVARAGIDDRNSIQSESIASGTTELQRVGGQFLLRELRLRPTLTAKPGDQFSFILNRELAFGEAP